MSLERLFSPSISAIKETNKEEYNDTFRELVIEGYRVCGYGIEELEKNPGRFYKVDCGSEHWNFFVDLSYIFTIIRNIDSDENIEMSIYFA